MIDLTKIDNYTEQHVQLLEMARQNLGVIGDSTSMAKVSISNGRLYVTVNGANVFCVTAPHIEVTTYIKEPSHV